jgi:multidrug resistance efflux pump
VTSCSTALTEASSAQTKVAGDIKQVAQDERALTAALESSGGSSGTSPSGVTGSSTGSTGSTSSTGSTGSTGSTAGSGTGSNVQATKKATPQQIAVDQASVDTATANLTDAQEAVAGANLVSTIAGTVASVGIADGDSVTAGSSSSTAQIVVIGKGSSYDLTTSIAVADIGKVAIGQEADVTPDSTNSTVTCRPSGWSPTRDRPPQPIR